MSNSSFLDKVRRINSQNELYKKNLLKSSSSKPFFYSSPLLLSEREYLQGIYNSKRILEGIKDGYIKQLKNSNKSYKTRGKLTPKDIDELEKEIIKLNEAITNEEIKEQQIIQRIESRRVPDLTNNTNIFNDHYGSNESEMDILRPYEVNGEEERRKNIETEGEELEDFDLGFNFEEETGGNIKIKKKRRTKRTKRRKYKKSQKTIKKLNN